MTDLVKYKYQFCRLDVATGALHFVCFSEYIERLGWECATEGHLPSSTSVLNNVSEGLSEIITEPT